MAVLIYALVGLGLCGVVYVVFIEPRWFHLGHVRVPVRGEFPGPLRILHITDTHLRKGHATTAKMRFLKGLAEHEVDFVFATGDMIDNPSGIEYCVEALDALKPRYGTYFVLGGHDHNDITILDTLHHLTHFRTSRRATRANEVDRLQEQLKEVGVTTLVNENVRVPVDNGEIVLIGLDDPFLDRHDLDGAMEGIADGDATIMLVHAPDIVDEIAEHGIDAVFCGHTHGGQIRVPFIGAMVTRCSLDPREACGLLRRKNTAFHLNRGLGAGWMTDFRFWCRPEATIVDLVPEEE